MEVSLNQQIGFLEEGSWYEGTLEGRPVQIKVVKRLKNHKGKGMPALAHFTDGDQEPVNDGFFYAFTDGSCVTLKPRSD